MEYRILKNNIISNNLPTNFKDILTIDLYNQLINDIYTLSIFIQFFSDYITYIIDFLISNNLLLTKHNGNLFFHYVIIYSNTDIINDIIILFTKNNILINIPNSQNRELLHLISLKKDYKHIINIHKLYHKLNLSFHNQDIYGNTPFHYICYKSSHNLIFNTITYYKSNLLIQNKDLNTYFHIISSRASIQTISFFIELYIENNLPFNIQNIYFTEPLHLIIRRKLDNIIIQLYHLYIQQNLPLNTKSKLYDTIFNSLKLYYDSNHPIFQTIKIENYN